MKEKFKKHSAHLSKEAALKEAARLRSKGKKVRIKQDPLTGKWIVEILMLAVAIGLLGAIFHSAK